MKANILRSIVRRLYRSRLERNLSLSPSETFLLLLIGVFQGDTHKMGKNNNKMEKKNNLKMEI